MKSIGSESNDSFHTTETQKKKSFFTNISNSFRSSTKSQSTLEKREKSNFKRCFSKINESLIEEYHCARQKDILWQVLQFIRNYRAKCL